jgi:hypothetical protein
MLTAKDLLYKSLDYDGFWNGTKRMRASKPSQCRWEQLDILLKAFGIIQANAKAESQTPQSGDDSRQVISVYARSGRPRAMHRIEYVKTLSEFNYLSTGEFLADIDKAAYQDLAQHISTAGKAIFPDQAAMMDAQPLNLVRLFAALYNYRLGAYHVLKAGPFGNRNLPFSLEDAYSLHLQDQFMRKMNENWTELEETICLLIDPQKRSFTEEELHLPVYDFAALDAEWERGLRQ